MAGALSLTIDFRELTAAAGGLRAAAGIAIKTETLVSAGNKILLSTLKAAAPVGKDRTNYAGALIHKGGTLRDSIVSRASGPEGRGFYGAFYGPYVVHGTAPHLILPSAKKALWWNGAEHPVGRANHPGTRPNDFVRRAVDQAAPALRVLMLENGRQLLRLIAPRAGGA